MTLHTKSSIFKGWGLIPSDLIHVETPINLQYMLDFRVGNQIHIWFFSDIN